MKIAYLGLFFALSSSPLVAKDFGNGNFVEERKDWQGDGKIVYLKADGTMSPTKVPDATPVLEMTLNKTQPRELTQKFSTEEGAGALNIEVVYKGSPDFKLNDKATKFTKGNTWSAGSTMYWTGYVIPKCDLVIRVDHPGGYAYYLAKVDPGADWKTLRVRFDDIGEKKDVKLNVIAAPGDGSLFVKSVAATK